MSDACNPGRDCPCCPRLVAFRHEARATWPDWFNAPVPTFDGAGPIRLLVVGLAPGLRGANRTGRPFTGDFAGQLLYSTLIAHGFAVGNFDARADDGLQLNGTSLTNAVRCVPPQNKPLPAEMHECRQFLERTMAILPDLRAIVALGRVAHESVVRARRAKLRSAPFKHGGSNMLDGVRMFDSYHCSRYNTNTGVLTPAMFHAVFAEVRRFLDCAR